MPPFSGGNAMRTIWLIRSFNSKRFSSSRARSTNCSSARPEGVCYSSRRETEIVRLVSQSLQNKEIADLLGISQGTIKIRNRAFQELKGGQVIVDGNGPLTQL